MTESHRVLDQFDLRKQKGFAEWLHHWSERAINGEAIRVFLDHDQTQAWVITTGDDVNTATSTPVKSAIEKARERLAREQAHLAALEEEAAAREQYVSMYRDGAPVEKLASMASMTPEKMRALLVAEGAIVARKRVINDSERGEVARLLRNGQDAPSVAELLNIAEAVVRRVARELGIVRPATRRTDAQLQQLAAFEEQVKQAYGAGFAALGEALRAWRKRQVETGGTPPAPVEAAYTEGTEPPPVRVLSPEDEAKMNEPDEDKPW